MSGVVAFAAENIRGTAQKSLTAEGAENCRGGRREELLTAKIAKKCRQGREVGRCHRQRPVPAWGEL